MQDPAFKERCIENFIAAGQRTAGRSKGELRLARLLEPYGWVHGHKIVGNGKWYFVDLFHPTTKRAVEHDGDWFHCHPRFDELIERCYGGLHPTKMLPPNEVRRLDEERRRELRELGIEVFPVWQDDVIRLSDDQVLDLLRSRSINE